MARSDVRLERMISMLGSHEKRVLSSAKLQMLAIKNKRSLINMLKRRGPRIEPCGTPRDIFSQPL